MLAKCQEKDETDFTRALKEICEEYDDKGTEKEDFMPDIDDGKYISCIAERLKDSIDKVQFTKNHKIQEAIDELEEMLKMQKYTSNQMHYDAFSKKHDIKREVHRQENWKKKHGLGENKKNPTTSLISSDKKNKKMLNSLQVGLKNHSS